MDIGTTTGHVDARRAQSAAARPSEVAASLEGVVEGGDQRGRLLGFPTANVAVPLTALRDGVWAGIVQISPIPAEEDEAGLTHIAAISIGHRPTYYGKDGQRLLEAHLLDFSGNLYGRRLIIGLYDRLRPQRSFAGSSDLVEQLQRDIQATRTWASARGLDTAAARLTALQQIATPAGDEVPLEPNR